MALKMKSLFKSKKKRSYKEQELQQDPREDEPDGQLATTPPSQKKMLPEELAGQTRRQEQRLHAKMPEAAVVALESGPPPLSPHQQEEATVLPSTSTMRRRPKYASRDRYEDAQDAKYGYSDGGGRRRSPNRSPSRSSSRDCFGAANDATMSAATSEVNPGSSSSPKSRRRRSYRGLEQHDTSEFSSLESDDNGDRRRRSPNRSPKSSSPSRKADDAAASTTTSSSSRNRGTSPVAVTASSTSPRDHRYNAVASNSQEKEYQPNHTHDQQFHHGSEESKWVPASAARTDPVSLRDQLIRKKSPRQLEEYDYGDASPDSNTAASAETGADPNCYSEKYSHSWENSQYGGESGGRRRRQQQQHRRDSSSGRYSNLGDERDRCDSREERPYPYRSDGRRHRRTSLPDGIDYPNYGSAAVANGSDVTTERRPCPSSMKCTSSSTNTYSPEKGRQQLQQRRISLTGGIIYPNRVGGSGRPQPRRSSLKHSKSSTNLERLRRSTMSFDGEVKEVHILGQGKVRRRTSIKFDEHVNVRSVVPMVQLVSPSTSHSNVAEAGNINPSRTADSNIYSNYYHSSNELNSRPVPAVMKGTPSTTSVNEEATAKSQLWFQPAEYQQMRQKSVELVDLVDRKGGIEYFTKKGGSEICGGRKPCIRGLEGLLAQRGLDGQSNKERKQSIKELAWDRVLEEQYWQTKEGVFDERAISTIYAKSTSQAMEEAQSRAMQDAKDIERYTKTTRNYLRRMSC